VLHVLASLSAGHKIGIGVVAAVFIAFALSASFLAPRRWPDFPGKNGMGPFVLACFVVFAGMLAAVYFFGKEPAEAKAKEATPSANTAGATINVTESEWKVQLPATGTLKQGTYTFTVHNAGKIPHDLVVSGGHVSGNASTPLIQPGKDAMLKVGLGPGTYTLYCAVPGHKQLGMVAKLSVS
jgi:uncharacterized cupredoxin-like copper-binding protein